MPAPLILAAALRALPAIVRGVREGLSIARIGAAIRGAGFHISNDALRSAVWAVRQQVDYASHLHHMGRDARPDPARLPEAITTIRSAYSYTVEVRGFTGDGHEFVSRHVTVATNRLLSRGQIEDAAIAAVGSDGGRYGVEVTGAVIRSGMRAGVAGRV